MIENMSEHEKNDLTDLKNIDDESVEEISHSYPMLGRSAKKRILEKCLAKTEDAVFDQSGITVSGTEVYKRPVWHRIAGTAAAAAAALAVVSGAIYMKMNMNPPVKDPISDAGSGTIAESTEENPDNMNENVYTSIITTTEVTKAMGVMTTNSSTSVSVIMTSLTTLAQTTTDVTDETTTTDVTTTDTEETTEATTETVAGLSAEILEGKWNAKGYTEDRIFEFFDDSQSGKIVSTSTGTGIAVTYEISGDTILFRFNSDEAKPDIADVDRSSDVHMTLHWEDGRSEELTKIVKEQS